MNPSAHPPRTDPHDPNALPFAAPCRPLTTAAPLRWLRLGWQDFRRAPAQSLCYGVAIVLISYFITALALFFGGYAVVLGLLSGFIFLGPLLALGLYDISRTLERGQTPTLLHGLREGWRHLGDELIFALIIGVVFLVWARAASMVHVFFPIESDPRWSDLALFFGIGSAIGSIFATIIFAVSAFSLPMIIDRQTDMVTAAITSINAVLRNKTAMVVWAALIVACVGVGFVTAYLGLAVLLPVIGHATWHAYQETIDAGAWPLNDPHPSPPPW